MQIVFLRTDEERTWTIPFADGNSLVTWAVIKLINLCAFYVTPRHLDLCDWSDTCFSCLSCLSFRQGWAPFCCWRFNLRKVRPVLFSGLSVRRRMRMRSSCYCFFKLTPNFLYFLVSLFLATAWWGVQKKHLLVCPRTELRKRTTQPVKTDESSPIN